MSLTTGGISPWRPCGAAHAAAAGSLRLLHNPLWDARHCGAPPRSLPAGGAQHEVRAARAGKA
eukprot:64195-Chlamydomonas_euryale.AAC.1